LGGVVIGEKLGVGGPLNGWATKNLSEWKGGKEQHTQKGLEYRGVLWFIEKKIRNLTQRER